jgi:small subunit ribosomal protein S3
MIERKFVKENIKENQIKEYISNTLRNVGHSDTKLQRTPLGEKIIVFASRPGLVVGRKGENIKKLTNTLKNKFGLENPQIEIEEVSKQNLNAQIVAERIASTIERFGIQKFKGVGHKTLQDVIDAGALGVEIIMSGKIPSQRARSWRFYKGYLKKSGELTNYMNNATTFAVLKTGTIGIKVSIMPPDIKLPDDIKVKDELVVLSDINVADEAAKERKKMKEVKESEKADGKKGVKKEKKKSVRKESKKSKPKTKKNFDVENKKDTEEKRDSSKGSVEEDLEV